MAKKEEKPSVREYRLHRGTHSFIDADGDRVEAMEGDLVPLTDEQYKNFIDKFEDPGKPKERVAPSGEPVPGRQFTEPADAAQLQLHKEELNSRVVDPNMGTSSEPTTPGLKGKEEAIQARKGVDPNAELKKNTTENAKATQNDDDKANADLVNKTTPTKK